MLLATDIGTPWLVAGVWWRMERSGRQCDWSVPNLQRIMARHFDTGRGRWDRADRATRAQVRDPPAAQAARRRAAGTRAATRAMGALRSEERRVGKEWRSGRAPGQRKQMRMPE